MKHCLALTPLLVLAVAAGCSSYDSTDTTSVAAHSTASQTSSTSSSSSSRSSSPAYSTTSSTSSATDPSHTHTTTAVSTATSTAGATRSTAVASAAPHSAASAFTCHYEEGDAPCNASEYAVNKTAWPAYQAQMNRSASVTSAPASKTPSADVARDANGFALGGPAYPGLPVNPSTAQCTTYRDALVAWSNYQNLHRPAGSISNLPMSGDVQNLSFQCHLSYPFSD